MQLCPEACNMHLVVDQKKKPRHQQKSSLDWRDSHVQNWTLDPCSCSTCWWTGGLHWSHHVWSRGRVQTGTHKSHQRVRWIHIRLSVHFTSAGCSSSSFTVLHYNCNSSMSLLIVFFLSSTLAHFLWTIYLFIYFHRNSVPVCLRLGAVLLIWNICRERYYFILKAVWKVATFWCFGLSWEYGEVEKGALIRIQLRPIGCVPPEQTQTQF